MNERDLRRFRIELKYHLYAEREMFEEGVMDVPADQDAEPKPAAAMPPVTVTVDFPISVRRRTAPQDEETPGFHIAIKKRGLTGDFELNPVRREGEKPPTLSDPDFPLNIRRREITSFPIVVRKRPQ